MTDEQNALNALDDLVQRYGRVTIKRGKPPYRYEIGVAGKSKTFTALGLVLALLVEGGGEAPNRRSGDRA